MRNTAALLSAVYSLQGAIDTFHLSVVHSGPQTCQAEHANCCSGASSQAQYGPSHAQGLHGRVKSYAEALQKLNEADRSREKVSAVKAFASAAAVDPDGTPLSPKDHKLPKYCRTPGHNHPRVSQGSAWLTAVAKCGFVWLSSERQGQSVYDFSYQTLGLQ